MPTYEYKCGACQHRFEQFQSMKDKALKKCPSCGKAKLERLIGTGAAIIFKGSGFYQTDYRSEAYKTAQKADKAEGAPAASGSEAGTKSGEATVTKSGSEAGSTSKTGEKASTIGAQESAAAKQPASNDVGVSKQSAKTGKGARGKPKD